MTYDGRFFITASLFPVMKSRPSILNFFTLLPLMVMAPSSSIFAPGSASTSASMTEPSGTRKASALYTSVSSFTTIFGMLAVTCAPSSCTASVSISISPRASRCPRCLVTWRDNSLYPR